MAAGNLAVPESLLGGFKARSDIHRTSGQKAEFTVEYQAGLAGIRYSGVITFPGYEPSRVGGFMAWTRKAIPPGRAVERTMRETLQFLDVDWILAGRSNN